MERNGQRLGRAVVRSEPQVIYTAEEPCVVHLHVVSKRLDGDGTVDSPEAIISVNVPPAIPYGDEHSPELPFDRAFPVFLDTGDALWAVSPGETIVSFSAVPRG